jgi:hypothetical protein
MRGIMILCALAMLLIKAWPMAVLCCFGAYVSKWEEE